LRLRIQEQPFQVLAALLARAGDVVTREELIRQLWPDGTHVDFDRGLNAAVARLRQVLNDSAETPRFIETVARKGYRFVAPVTSGEPTDEIAPIPVANATMAVRRGTYRTRAAVVAVVLVVSLTAAWWLGRRTSKREVVLQQITRDRGLSIDPALSPNGELVAYASDRAGANLNIWVQQLAPGGTAIRLTHEEVDAAQPAFSPDGTQIVYRSERDGGGIDVIPTVGGQSRRLALQGRNPRFSPDGQWIAYWIGVEKGAAPENDPSGQVFIIPAEGGAPRQIGPNMPPGGNPMWAPDSARLLVFANPPLSTGSAHDSDWWVAPLDGPARKTGSFSVLRDQGFVVQYASSYPRATAWLEKELIFSAQKGDTRNVWRVPFGSVNGAIEGTAERMTAGTTSEISASILPSGLLAFTSLQQSTAIWAIPMNRQDDTGLTRLTDGETSEVSPSISSDGRYLSFTARWPTETAWIKDLVTGQSTRVVEAVGRSWRPVLSADGSSIALNLDSPDAKGIFIKTREGTELKQVRSEPAWIVAWTPDKQNLLYISRTPSAKIERVNVNTRRTDEFLSKSGSSLFQPRFSPDGKWLTFEEVIERPSGHTSRIHVAPLQNGQPEAPVKWVAVTGESGWADKPRWSSDGNSIVFISDRDGFQCVWSQSLQPATKQPVGDPKPLFHFHSRRLSPVNVGLSLLEIEVAGNKVVIGLGELTGNVWSATSH
jgi:Tol biopolymer transport system component/DNA-binding winged helix-turn-helix (wHTH) protein